jgi:hypothetical protein
MSIPTDINPINDHTGEMCTEYQDGPVWFLLGSGGGKAERSCTVPAGKAILIPNIIIECSYAEDQSLQTIADLETCAKEGIDITTEVWATIDGEELPESELYRIKSAPFNFSFPENNVFGAPAGPTQGVSDGYWTFIKPLAPGEHTIHVGGLQVDYTVTTPTNFVEDSTYHLTIAGAPTRVSNHNIKVAGEDITIPINTTSSISDLVVSEETARVGISVAENSTVGEMMLPISRVLNGPYAVTMNNATQDFDLSVGSDGETWLRMEYGGGDGEIAIVGSSVVPEFPIALAFVVVSGLGAVIFLSRQSYFRHFRL